MISLIIKSAFTGALAGGLWAYAVDPSTAIQFAIGVTIGNMFTFKKAETK